MTHIEDDKFASSFDTHVQIHSPPLQKTTITHFLAFLNLNFLYILIAYIFINNILFCVFKLCINGIVNFIF